MSFIKTTPKDFAKEAFDDFLNSQPDVFKSWGWGHNKLYAKHCAKIYLEKVYRDTKNEYYKEALKNLEDI